MKRIFEFKCSQGHVHEAYTDKWENECPACTEVAYRIISAPRIKLDGISGHFPTASDKWARNHEEATRVARKRNEGRDQE